VSRQQGTGEITLFFQPAPSLCYPAVVIRCSDHFLDFLSRDSRGRKVLFVMIGSASATGNMSANQRFSRGCAGTDHQSLNVPHELFKMYRP